MPETFSEMVQARQTARSRAQEEARRKEELKLRKLAYLDERKQHATTSMYKAGPDALVLSDESDEDLVVEDTMQVVAREEAANRLKRSPPKKGAEVQRKFAAKSPRKGGLPPSPEKVAKFLTEAAQPSFSLGKSKTTRPTMDLKDLNRVLLTKAESVGEKVRRDKEQEWERRGHTVSRVLAPAKDNPMEQLLGKALERRNRDVPMDEDEDADDEDWVPEERGSASPEPPDAPDDEYAENLPEDRDDNPMVDGQDADLEDDAEILPPVVRGRAHRRAIADSDGESDDDAENAAPPPPSHGTVMSSFPPSPSFPSPSPMPDVETELELGNETDKENMKDRMFDRGEDKENKAVARHRLFGSALAMDDDDELPSPARLFQSPPLEDDPFSFSQTPVKEKQAALTRLRSPLPSLALSPAFGKKGKGRAGLSQFFDDDAGAEVEGGGFGDVFASGSSPSKQTQNLEGLKMDLGGLSQAFEQTQDKISFDVLRRDTTEFSLTLDAQALQPALEVDDHLLQKAAQIFEKEQEYLLDAAQPVAAKKHKPQLYVNDNGFLTQTRPDVASPELYRPSPSQPAHVFSIFRQTQASQSVLGSVQRKPLGTLAVDDVDETPSHKPLRRLRRAGDSPIGGLHAVGGYRSSPSPSPSPMRKLNAFDALQAGAQRAEKAKKRQLGRSEFVEAEAEESDEDDMLGFGGVRKKGADDDDDEDGDDKEVEGLMDDAEMSEDAIAREKVMEKHQEHQEEDDARLEKIARDAIEGKLRTKRRSGVGLGDSDSEDDEDEHAREQRRRMAKKRKIHDDELEDLAKQPETMPFYNTYHHGLVDDGTEFAHLQQDDLMADDSDTENVEAGPRETVSAADIRKELQVMAQQKLWNI
ncbi:hypothetical protein BV25DRAFT_115477 [Artomyces pyxidatus]|uniref:Uncharacterized protein n=1 Tax=Artomyces pyxidatus TaxID=48021 RepID=A0ACB8TLE2_9AGAM|nr:hypothetical protein BV25DRAFT_115477 [Artomyces pyxidatus]